MAKHTIAIIFDFDDTLVPDSLTALLNSKKIDTDKFWKNDVKSLVNDGWDPVHAYLKLFFDLTKPGKPFEGITNNDLRKFGNKLKPYPGVADFFDQIKKWTQESFGELDIDVEYWVISGGLEEIINGCELISKKLRAFWGCRLEGDTPSGPVKYIKRSISFTEKTRYVFEINKGLLKKQTDKNPLLVNKEITERPIDFRNMIYIGDGITDVPCLSLIKNFKGAGIGIIDEKKITKLGKAKREVFQDLVNERRAISYHFPNYKDGSELTSIIKTIISNRCSTIILNEDGVK
jgi:phosphoserine phosphatase